MIAAAANLKIPILAYHDVAPLCDQQFRNLTVPPENFEWQMRSLANDGYTAMTASTYAQCLAGQSTFPAKPILITFDDAYANLIEYAFPVLQSVGFSASIFVITGKMGQALPWDGRVTMTEQQIVEWARQGIEFGCHTRTHPDLRGLGAAELIEEIRGSRDDLEKLLARRPVGFAYPYGAFDAGALECVRQDFKVAFSLEEGLNDSCTDPMLLRRTEVLPSEGRLAFGWRLRMGYHPLRRLRMYIGIRTRLRRLWSRASFHQIVGRLT